MSRKPKKRKKDYSNSKKKKRLLELGVTDLEAFSNELTLRCKFNFSYIDGSQEAAPGLDGVSDESLRTLVVFLKEMSHNSLNYWVQQGRYVEYGSFPPPNKTAFSHPPFVPIQAVWGRFRVTGACRVVGFTIPTDLDGKVHSGTGMLFDRNTFYVVFLDIDHQFWKTDR